MVAIATKIENGDRGEDRLAVHRSGEGAVIVVADGAGGVGGAAAAAQSLCDLIVRRAAAACGNPRVWSDALRDADVALAGSAHGGLTAGVVVELSGTEICGASVGDCGAWSVSASGVVDLTAKQLRKPLLGSGAAEPVAFGPVPLKGRLLAASDGLFKYARARDLATRVREGSLEEAAEGLVGAVRLRNGKVQDDVAVVLCEAAGEPAVPWAARTS